ncbi:MAG: TonB-dependent receptor [Bryobacteraceae bacterium]|jgi:outer membrane receptor protein involved in Fe transport
MTIFERFNSFSPVFRAVLLLPVVALCCLGQLATVQGEVRDPSGAVVPAADVKVTNVRTGVSAMTATNDRGYYSVPGLIPGEYKVETTAKGFETALYSNLTLDVNQTARVDFSLQPGVVVQTVNVAAEATALNSETSTVGQVISNQTVVQLPLNGRNYLQLAALTAGVAPPTGMRNSSEDSFAALGQQVYQTNILLDGIDNATRAGGGELGYQMQAVKPSVDAVEQFQVATNNVSAEYGVRMGATVIVVTKSGTNQLHGSLYEFLRNGDLDAVNFFSVGQTKPAFHQHQFGGTVGGPIIKNKLFFFGSAESLRIDMGTTNISTLPTDAEKSGNYAGRSTIFDPATTTAVASGDTRTPFPNNAIPASRFDPVALKAIALYPEPNLANTANNYYFSSPQTSVQNEYDGRGDYNISSAERLFVRYSHRDFNELEPGNLPLPAAGGKWETVLLHANNITGNLDTTFSPTATNELRLGYSRVNSVLGVPDTVNYNAQLGIQGLPPGLGSANDTGLTLFGPTNYAQVGTQNFWPNTNNFGIYQISDTFSKVLGTHVMKFGVQLMREYNYRLASRYSRGNITFAGYFTQDPNNRGKTGDAMADFLLGDASGGTLGNPQGEAMLTHNYSGFFQDDWRVTPKLTLNVGVRWDRFGPPSFHHIPAARYELQYGSQNYSVVYPTSMSDCGCVQNNYNFSPRLGLAYQATHNTVVRAGFGTYYGEPSIEDADGARYFIEPPTWTEISFPTDELFQPALVVSQGFPTGLFPVTAVRSNSSINVAQQQKPNQYTLEWFFDVQRQLPSGIVVTASYIGEGARDIAWTQNLNAPLSPGAGVLQQRRPWPFFGTITLYPPGASVDYDGLALKAEKRYSNGLVLIASYTWGHDLDTGNGMSLNDDTSSIRDPYNLALDRGNAAYDLRHSLVASFNYDLPFGKGKHWLNRGGPADWVLGGWQLGGILTLQSGPYFTPTLSVDLANMGTTNFPNLLTNPNLPSGQRSIHDWFNLAAFALPQQYVFGNAGRGVAEAPGVHNMDLKIGKGFPIRERFHLDFRAEMFNFTNTPHFGMPNATVNSAQEGTITSTTGNPRQIQFALKLIF